jgi:hypothetical protein
MTGWLIVLSINVLATLSNRKRAKYISTEFKVEEKTSE